jgi:hypothetical protein
MLAEPLNAKENMERGIALQAIANSAKEIADKGGSNLDVQTFIQGSKRELARELSDKGKMGKAAKAANAYKQLANQ